MRRRDVVAVATLVIGASLVGAAGAQTPSAKPAASAKPATSASASASAKPATAASATAAQPNLPPGHPPMNDEPDNPHGQGGPPGMFRPPEDAPTEDATLPPGSIAVDVRDADDKPVAGQAVTLGILIQSVAKGDDRSHRAQTTDDGGHATFSGLDSGAGIAYRVSVVKDGATFAAMPFQLPQGKSIRVPVHVFPVTHDIRQAFIGFESIVYAEIRDDRIQFQQALRVYNIGKVAWVPDNIVMSLPESFTALNANQSMSDQGIDPIEKKGARLRGTFPPGQHVIEYRWQLPWSGDKDVVADIGLPPQTAVIRVMAAASEDMRLDVDGLPRAEMRTDDNGQNILITERRMQRGEEAMSRIHVALRDLPTQGSSRYWATGIAFVTVVAGLVLALGQPRKRATSRTGDAKVQRKQLLAELEELERAHAAGDVGPKTYEAARRRIIDAIARTLAKSAD